MADDWADRLADLRFEGESVVESVPVGDGRVVVTSHRLLSYDPAGAVRFRAVERPNVAGVRIETGTRADLLALAARPALWGVALVVAGLLLPADDLLSTPSVPAGTGLGGVVSTVESIFGLLALLDDLLLAAGALALLVALGALALSRVRRRRELVIEVAGDHDVRLPAAAADEATVAAIREAVEPG